MTDQMTETFQPTYTAENGTPIMLVGHSWIEPVGDGRFLAVAKNGAFTGGDFHTCLRFARANQPAPLFTR